MGPHIMSLECSLQPLVQPNASLVLGSVPFYLVLSLIWACVVVKDFHLPKDDPHSSDIDPLS